MATYADQYTLSADAGFLHRVEQAAIVAALAVIAQTDPNSGQLALAQRVMADPAGIATVLAKAVVTDPTVAATAPAGTSLTDAQLQTAVNATLLKFVR